MPRKSARKARRNKEAGHSSHASDSATQSGSEVAFRQDLGLARLDLTDLTIPIQDINTLFCLVLRGENLRTAGPLPGAAWEADSIRRYISHRERPDLQEPSDIIVVGQEQAVVFFGDRLSGEGLVEEEAAGRAENLCQDTDWCGIRATVSARHITLAAGLRRVQDARTTRSRNGSLRASEEPATPVPNSASTPRRGNQGTAMGGRGSPPPSESNSNNNRASASRGERRRQADPGGGSNGGPPSHHSGRGGRADPSPPPPPAGGAAGGGRRGAPRPPPRRAPPPDPDGDGGDGDGGGDHSDDGGGHDNSALQRRARKGGSGKIPTFNVFKNQPGEGNSVSYREWRHDVRAAMKADFAAAPLLFAVKKSLLGEPGELVREFGDSESLEDMLHVLDNAYAQRAPLGTLLGELFSIKQKRGEEVTSFGVRLARALGSIRTQHPGTYTETQLMAHRRTCYFDGLRLDIRGPLKYLYDDPANDYFTLHEKARETEKELEDERKDRKIDSAPQKPIPRTFLKIPNGLNRRDQQLQPISVPVQAEEPLEEVEPAEEEDLPPDYDPEDPEYRAFEIIQRRAFFDSKKRASNGAFPETRECYNCHEIGHLAAACPKKSTLQGNAIEGGRTGAPSPRNNKPAVARTAGATQ